MSLFILQEQLQCFPGLTGDMEVEDHPVEAQRVARCGRYLVDAHLAVHMLDPILDRAYVDIGYSRAVTKVHSYACC